MARKKLDITLYMSELIYDFQNKAYITGISRRAGGVDAEAASKMQASDDDEDVNQALRSIQGAYGKLLSELSEGLSSGEESTSTNELIDGAENIEIHLSLPSNYNLGLKDALTSNIHDYIVNKSLMDWFTITNPSEAKTYEDMAAIALNSIHETFNRRERPSRKSVNE